MLNVVAEHIKAQSMGGMVSVSSIMAFLHRQLLCLPVLNSGEASESKPIAGERLDSQESRFQTAAVALAEMQMHARRMQKRNTVHGARQTVEFLARSLLPLEGQTVPEQSLLQFLDSHAQQHTGDPSPDDIVSRRQPGVQQLGGQQGTAGWAPARPTQPQQHCEVGMQGTSPMNGKKRSYDVLEGAHIDPAFEQAFKRQCQLPPTPPRFHARRPPSR